MKAIKNKKNGFSLVEVLVAISINLLVIVMIMGVVLPGLRHIYMIKNERDMHAAAQSLTTQFNYWIKQGADITALSPTTLEIELPDDSIKTITMTLIEDEDEDDKYIITIDGDSLLANNVIVDYDPLNPFPLKFTEMDRSVRIEFTLKIDGTDDVFSATTTVAQRNSL